MQKYKTKIITAAVVIAVLAAAFLWSGNHSVKNDPSANEAVTQQAALPSVTTQNDHQSSDDGKITMIEDKTESVPHQAAKDEPTLQQNDDSDVTSKQNEMVSASADNTQPAQHNEAPDDGLLTCTISIRCDTVLNNIDRLGAEKADLVPADGIILAQKQATFYDGETVFDVLKRETRNSGVHLEFVNTPMYDSSYIEGIANLYEFDCGELSGWMYRVNGSFPNYGCSQYRLKDGDKIEWLYTCDLGKDVGNEYAVRNGM